MSAPACPICRATDAEPIRSVKPWHCNTCNTVFSGTQGELAASREDRERYQAIQITVTRLRGESPAPQGKPPRRLRVVPNPGDTSA